VRRICRRDPNANAAQRGKRREPDRSGRHSVATSLTRVPYPPVISVEIFVGLFELKERENGQAHNHQADEIDQSSHEQLLLEVYACR
jgi:hypothetical protein